MSKLRYGLQFCSQVRTKIDDPTNQNIKAIQIAQNKMLRMLEGVSLKELVDCCNHAMFEYVLSTCTFSFNMHVLFTFTFS